jgi:glycosyltransferase involved in cell wall biosynthesis
MTSVSVIIPTFNRASTLCRAVSSVLFQTFKDYEIIVVDDGSEDDTPKRLSQFNNHINYIKHSKNLGVSSARNSGIRESRAPLVAFLDSDDYWLPEKLAAQVDFLKSQPRAVACQTEEIWVRRGRRVNPMKKHLKPSGDVFEASLGRCLVSPSAVLLRRWVLSEVGLFDERLPACEDYDLWLRIACQYPIHLIRRPLVVKVGGHSDQLSMRYEGMDRFRIRALVKIIESGRLQNSQRQAALKELDVKCRIYGDGCLKRGRKREGEYYLQIPRLFEAGHSLPLMPWEE